ncbi:MAG: DUF2281 domain-containing protein [Acidobacteriota bacterium]
MSELAAEAEGGEEVVMTRDDGAAFKLVPLGMRPPTPTFGSAKGLIEIAEDFDEPLEDFKDYES